MTAIYTITTIGLHADHRFRSRTWGFYLTLDEAIEGMHKCVDTGAGYYTHVVIESFQPGIYATADSEAWFEWTDGWKACAKPDAEQGCVSYGMG